MVPTWHNGDSIELGVEQHTHVRMRVDAVALSVCSKERPPYLCHGVQRAISQFENMMNAIEWCWQQHLQANAGCPVVARHANIYMQLVLCAL